jgi:hypothetical protein
MIPQIKTVTELINQGYTPINGFPTRFAKLNGVEAYVFELEDHLEERCRLIYYGRSKELVDILGKLGELKKRGEAEWEN